MLIAFILIVIHYIADFMFQTEEMALGKSKSFLILLKHTFVYTGIFYIAFVFWIVINGEFLGYNIFKDVTITDKIILFFPITFLCHTVIDYVSSKITARKFEKKEFYTGIPNMGAFSIIGLDQVFHYGTLFLTYYFLTV